MPITIERPEEFFQRHGGLATAVKIGNKTIFETGAVWTDSFGGSEPAADKWILLKTRRARAVPAPEQYLGRRRGSRPSRSPRDHPAASPRSYAGNTGTVAG